MDREKLVEAMALAMANVRRAACKLPPLEYLTTVKLDEREALIADARAALAVAEPEGEVVEVAVWRDNDDGEVVFCIPKTERDDPLQGWTRLGTTRLAVKKGEGA